jgi:hypothetical protein
MRARRLTTLALATGCLALAAQGECDASEYAFSTYGLGGMAFGAGVTPPPGTYLTTVVGRYSGELDGAIQFGGVTINAGAKVEGFTNAYNLLYVPNRKLFGGNLGLSLTVPVGHVDVDATIGPIFATTDGWGLGDIVGKAQLGWQRGEFAHTLYVQAVAPTGRWDPGFSPIIGLHRPGIDMGWAVTWANKATKLQLNGAAGYTVNFENTETDYRSGDEFHFEWAIGREFAPGLVLGIVGYDYRQVTGDSGPGALLGPLKGRVDAVGPGLSYTTLVGKTPLVFNMRHYWEFNAENRWEGSSSIISATLRF